MEKMIGQVVSMAMLDSVKTATKYVSEKQTVKATRRRHKGQRKTDPFEIVVTIGRPNHAEQKFIGLCKRAGVSFPVKKIQLKLRKGR